MKWKDYYERYDNWAESTQYSRTASITDFGPATSPSDEITDCLQYVDKRTGTRILLAAIKAGVLFKADEITEILEVGFLDEKYLDSLLGAVDGEFTADQICGLTDLVCDESPVTRLIEKACSRKISWSGSEILKVYESVCDDTLLEKMLNASTGRFTEDELNELCDLGVRETLIKKISLQSGIPYADPEDDEDTAYEGVSREPEKFGLSDLLAALAFGATKSGHGNKKKCSGDCANCPPHYGFRYGRWYYGHGHNYGCEFGGNRGGGSD